MVLTALCLAGTASVIRRTAAGIAGAERGILAGLLLLGTDAALGYMRMPYLVDPATLLLDACALEAGRRRRWGVVCAVLVLGGFNRETMLFALLPLTAWAWQAEHGRRKRVAVGGMWLCAFAVQALLRATPLLYGTIVSTSHQSPGEILAWNSRKPGGLTVYLILALLGSLGALWYYLPRIVRAASGYVASSLWLLIPVVASILIASDWARLLAVGAIVVVPAAAVLLRRSSLVILAILQPFIVGVAMWGWILPAGFLAVVAIVLCEARDGHVADRVVLTLRLGRVGARAEDQQAAVTPRSGAR